MSLFCAMIAANQQMQRDLHALGPISGNKLRTLRSRKAGSSRPISFVRYRDPEDRFELSYPAEWKLNPDLGVHASSALLGSFVRVDVVEESTEIWKQLGLEAAQAGGALQVRSHRPGSPEVVTGHLVVGETRFSWSGCAWRINGVKVILSLGNVLDPARSRAIESYEDRILSAIRRHFKLGPGLLPSTR